MKLAVFGNYGVKNIGDDLILMGLREKFEQDELLVYCGNPDQVKEQFNLSAHPFFPGGFRSMIKYLFSASYRVKIRQAYSELKSVDKILIGGGGILVDRHFKAIILWWRQLRAISKTKIPFEFIANSFELKHWWSKLIFKKYLKQAKKITVRDSTSLEFINSLDLEADLVQDLSWNLSLEDANYNSLMFSRSTRELSPCKGGRGSRMHTHKKICLALCQWGLQDQQKLALKEFINRRRQEGYEIVGLAFQSLGDDDRQLLAEIDPEMEVINELTDILTELRNSTLLLGMRFHSLLLAMRLNKPLIALAYQDKVSNLMDDQGMTELCLPIQKLDEQNLQELFEKAIEAKR